MIQWSYYPRSKRVDWLAFQVVEAFKAEQTSFDSASHALTSNGVLALVRDRLIALGFDVECGKRESDKIAVPVLFGRNGKAEKSFFADAYHANEGFVLEVEAGRGVVNNQFLKDFFQACMMNEVRHLAIAIRTVYRGNTDFETVCRFFDTLYASNRLTIPLRAF